MLDKMRNNYILLFLWLLLPIVIGKPLVSLVFVFFIFLFAFIGYAFLNIISIPESKQKIYLSAPLGCILVMGVLGWAVIFKIDVTVVFLILNIFSLLSFTIYFKEFKNYLLVLLKSNFINIRFLVVNGIVLFFICLPFFLKDHVSNGLGYHWIHPDVAWDHSFASLIKNEMANGIPGSIAFERFFYHYGLVSTIAACSSFLSIDIGTVMISFRYVGIFLIILTITLLFYVLKDENALLKKLKSENSIFLLIMGTFFCGDFIEPYIYLVEKCGLKSYIHYTNMNSLWYGFVIGHTIMWSVLSVFIFIIVASSREIENKLLVLILLTAIILMVNSFAFILCVFTVLSYIINKTINSRYSVNIVIIINLLFYFIFFSFFQSSEYFNKFVDSIGFSKNEVVSLDVNQIVLFLTIIMSLVGITIFVKNKDRFLLVDFILFISISVFFMYFLKTHCNNQNYLIRIIRHIISPFTFILLAIFIVELMKSKLFRNKILSWISLIILLSVVSSSFLQIIHNFRANGIVGVKVNSDELEALRYFKNNSLKHEIFATNVNSDWILNDSAWKGVLYRYVAISERDVFIEGYGYWESILNYGLTKELQESNKILFSSNQVNQVFDILEKWKIRYLVYSNMTKMNNVIFGSNRFDILFENKSVTIYKFKEY